jgi:MSHA biogenesis protein MshL
VKSVSQLLSVAAAMVALSGCSYTGNASPPRLDHEEGGGKPVYRPMVIVPLPALQRAEGPVGKTMDALQARQTPVGDVLLALFKDSDINLLIDPSVQATECTFDIKKSTVEETFEALLSSLDLGYEWDGSFLRIRDTVRETLHVDLMDSQQDAGSSDSKSSSSSGSQSTSASANFWDELQGALPTLLGEKSSTVINRTASTIHVEARPSGIARLRELIDTTVRRANKQVSLEARILEVRLDDAHSLGVNWSLLPHLFNSNKTGLAVGGAAIAQTAASGGSALKFGVLDTGDFSVFLDALQRQGQVRVLSSPRVSTMNNKPASIGITDQIPVITREVIDDQGVARTEYGVDFVESGVTLSVQPMIGEDGILSVAVTPKVREQTGTVVTPDGLIEVPIISQREATTLVRVANGQAIALGGLRSTRKDETRQGIPFLMDLPYLGQLFSSTVQTRTEVELMILLAPRVLDDTWIDEEVHRSAHRIVQLRRGFQWNSIDLDGHRPEDWTSGSLQGRAMAAGDTDVRVPDVVPAALPADRGLTVTRMGLAAHLLGRAQKELESGAVQGAIATIEKAIELEPRNGDALVAEGVLLARQGNLSRARTLLDRAIELKPDDVVALTARGSVEMTDGSPFAAKRFMERAHELGHSPLTAANLGAAMLALGDDEGARVFLRAEAVPNAPAELHSNLAFAELVTGHLVQARESLQRALVAGVDSRNPRMVALENLIREAEQVAASDAGK